MLTTFPNSGIPSEQGILSKTAPVTTGAPKIYLLIIMMIIMQAPAKKHC
jgi:hypothetical protein